MADSQINEGPTFVVRRRALLQRNLVVRIVDIPIVVAHVYLHVCWIAALQFRHVCQLLKGQGEHGVAALVVKFVAPLGVRGCPRDPVILGHAHPAPQQVARGGAGVHAELARGDNAEAAVRGQVGSLRKPLEAVGPVGHEICLLGEHGELGGQRSVAQGEGGGLATPGLQVGLGVLDENVEGVRDLLHDAEEVDVLPADLRGSL